MAMEDMWNVRTSLNRPPGQPSPGPSTVNQVLHVSRFRLHAKEGHLMNYYSY